MMPDATRSQIKLAQIKLAGSLVGLGMGISILERYGLSQLRGTPLPGWLIASLAIAPLVLVLSGAAVFVISRLRRR